MLKLIAAAIAFGLAGQAAAGGMGDDAALGIAAYRAGDIQTAKDLLTPIAHQGDARAQRYVAYIHLDTNAKLDFDPERGVKLLSQAAREGDYAALIKLEELRQKGLAFSPSLDDLIDIEEHRAEKGDPVLAWRLARRYEEGDGVAASDMASMRWLEIAAQAPESKFPKSGEAAYKLCVLHARIGDDADARDWCAAAAERGDAAAAVMLGRLAP